MKIYWVALLLTCVLSYLIIYNYKKNDSIKKITHGKVFLSFLPLFLVELFRWNVGVDVVYGTGYYYYAYRAISNGYGNIYNYEPGFYLLMKICNLLHFNLYLFYCVVTILFYILFTKFLANNSKNIIQSAIIFVLSDLYLFTFSTLRQSLGIAFALYPLTSMLKDNKYYKNWKWWLSLILSFSMHRTILYLFIILFFSTKKIKRKNLIILTTFACVLNPIIQNLLLSVLSRFYYFTKYLGSNMNVNSFSLTYFAISLILFVIALCNYKKLVEINKKNYILINFCAYTTILMIYSKLLIMPYRIFPLFIPIYIVLSSKIISSIHKHTYKYLFTTIYIVVPFLLLFINQYYVIGGNKIFAYKSIFEYIDQVWPNR